MKRDIWVFLFCIGGLFFTWPIMYIFRDSLQHYLFGAWLLFILFIFLAVKFSIHEDSGG